MSDKRNNDCVRIEADASFVQIGDDIKAGIAAVLQDNETGEAVFAVGKSINYTLFYTRLKRFRRMVAPLNCSMTAKMLLVSSMEKLHAQSGILKWHKRFGTEFVRKS